MNRSPVLGMAATFAAFLTPLLHGNIILEYGTAGSTTSLAPLASDPVVTPGNLEAGTGINVQAFSTFNFTSWDPANTSYAEALADDEVWTWGFTVTTADRQVDLTTMDIRLDRSSTGPDDFEIRASVNGGTSTTLLTYDYGGATVGVDFLDVNLGAIGTVSTGDVVVFTLAAFNAQGTSGTFDLELVSGENFGIQINGTVTIGSGPDTFPPIISTLSPVDNAIEVALDSNLVATFNEPIQAGTGNVTLRLSSDNSIVESFIVGSPNASIAGNTLTLNPTADLLEATPYYVQFPVGAIEDLSGNDFAGITDPTTWNFSSDSGSLPPDVAYYTAAAGLTGTSLINQLEQIIDGHTVIPYGSNGSGVWAAHADLYEDPNNSSNLILFYSQASINKTLQDSGSPDDYWNREHLWPQSYGGNVGDAFSDLFHVVPAYKGVNSSRTNKYFEEVHPGDSGYNNPAHPLAPDCKANSDAWEPADGQKGRVARALFYMATRYKFDANLELIDTPEEGTPAINDTLMADRSTLLEWNRKFLPVLTEQQLNQNIFDNYQGNRNPYIDFPEFADAVWITGPSWGGWRIEHFTLAELANPAISGDAADPDNDRIPNIVEMAMYTDPLSPDAQPLSGTAGTTQVTLTFIRAADMTHLNLDLRLEFSTDFQTWDPVPLGGATIVPLNGTQESVTVSRTLAPDTREFYRLEAERL
jgi:endonuclease I